MTVVLPTSRALCAESIQSQMEIESRFRA